MYLILSQQMSSFFTCTENKQSLCVNLYDLRFEFQPTQIFKKVNGGMTCYVAVRNAYSPTINCHSPILKKIILNCDLDGFLHLKQQNLQNCCVHLQAKATISVNGRSFTLCWLLKDLFLIRFSTHCLVLWCWTVSSQPIYYLSNIKMKKNRVSTNYKPNKIAIQYQDIKIAGSLK